MSYLITLTIFYLLCARGMSAQGESNADDTLQAQGINHAAVDFPGQTSVVKSTTSDSSGDGIDSKFIWKPIGRQRNEIKYESVVPYFKYDKGSGEDDQPRIEAPKALAIWIVNKTTEQKLESTTQRPKTLQDRKRKVAEEKAYFIYERRLRKTNWCFKETADSAKRNYKFKKTEGCCQRHKECQARLHVKRGIHECSCDIYFHMCLRKVDTKMAKSIEKMYFNRNIVCYKKNNSACAEEPCANVIYVWKIISGHLK